MDNPPKTVCQSVARSSSTFSKRSSSVLRAVLMPSMSRATGVHERVTMSVLAVILPIAAIIVYACGSNASPPMLQTAAPSSPQITACDASLWNYVYDPSRLRVIDACRTVTGTITDQHANEDGDIDVRLEVDPEFKNLLNAGNISNLSGHLQTEAICQAPIADAAAARTCQGFRGSVSVPPNGTRVRVTGTYVLDLHHGWMEIHPISVLTVIR
jgi:hypothetical protein